MKHIVISEETKSALDKIKLHPRETYEGSVKRLIEEHNSETQKGTQ